ncbi:MAG: ferrous iron transport protein B [Selenomonadales bacterium]|nr:ferrous iron transport protein B [Selenomonadales bacterium]
MKEVLSVALAGNPNVGKTTIFNRLTGARQKVGNWPGVTVDKKVGTFEHGGHKVEIIDLPGTYSLNARSAEEKVVVDYLLSEPPSVIVNVLDASNLERNLFLTLQLLEYKIPTILTLNMMDEADANGIHIDTKKIEKIIGMPVVAAVAKEKNAMHALVDAVTGSALAECRLSDRIEKHIAEVKELRAKGGAAVEEAVADLRYVLINEILKAAVTKEKKEAAPSWQDKLDAIVTHPVLAIPIFLGLVYLVFKLTFEWVGQVAADALAEFIEGPFTDSVVASLESAGVEDWVFSLVVDGIIGGVGGVLSFVPLIFCLFFFLSILDGTGYMARVAFTLDALMNRVGLTGKSIMPLVMGFGCSVPAIMASRAMDTEKDRKITMFVLPFISCGAKLPVYALFAAVFFPDCAADVVMSLYVLGIVVALVMASIFKRTLNKDDEGSFLLELPPYRFPTMLSVLLETWEKGKGYLYKAGTVIFAMSVLIWFLSSFSFDGMVDMNESFLAFLGGLIAPLFTFHGFATWEAGAALITGIAAKEVVVATMGVLYEVGEIAEEAEEAAQQMGMPLQAVFTNLSAYTFMVFSLLYTPCMTALGTLYKELGSAKGVLQVAAYTFAVAWVVALVVYQGGKLLGFE